jgi:hypothetical protein
MVIARQTLACYELTFLPECNEGSRKYRASPAVVAISSASPAASEVRTQEPVEMHDGAGLNEFRSHFVV